MNYKNMMPLVIGLCLVLISCSKACYGADDSVPLGPPAATLPEHYPLSGYAILPYINNADPVLVKWMDQRFEYWIGGANKPLSKSVKWATYHDLYGLGSLAEFLIFKDWAAAHSLVAEKILLHAKVDYTSALNPSWHQMDKFDNFEGANGVLHTTNDKTFTDLTSTAYQSEVKWQDTVYVGYEEPFDQINLTLAKKGSGITRIWEYWNGTGGWVALTVTDGTATFTQDGRVAFLPPSDWKPISIHGSRVKYFVRCRITGSSALPVTSSVKGDTWQNDGKSACRGWDPSDSHIINKGTALEYNPTPPGGKSARFPYQARVSFWANNHFIANPADLQKIDGTLKRTWAQFLAYRINQITVGRDYTMVMGDDGEASPDTGNLKAVNTDFNGSSWVEASLAKYSDLVTTLHSLNPLIKMGLNGQSKKYSFVGDWNLAEYQTYTYNSGGSLGNGNIPINEGSPYVSYDSYLPANNPKGNVGIFIFADVVDTIPNRTARFDRSNRGPIHALSQHLIGKNSHTIFSYYSTGGYVYPETDEVVLTDNSVVHLSRQPAPPLAKVKRWATWFPAMAVDVGVPESGGWDGAVRNLAWKSRTEIGGRTDVWRRDFTKAIVLNRPSMWNTTDEEFNTPSTPMQLGGTYYPLRADGTVGAGISSISLREGEGAILMKASAFHP
jgi:hypothetical protein